MRCAPDPVFAVTMATGWWAPEIFSRTSNPEFIREMPQWPFPSNQNPSRFPPRFPLHGSDCTRRDLPEPAGTKRNSNRRPRRESVGCCCASRVAASAPRHSSARVSPPVGSTRTHRLFTSKVAPPRATHREKMSAVVAGNLLALAGTAKPLRGKRGRSATRTRRVVSAAANADDARVADVKRAVVATLASTAIALPAVRDAQIPDPPLRAPSHPRELRRRRIFHRTRLPSGPHLTFPYVPRTRRRSPRPSPRSRSPPRSKSPPRWPSSRSSAPSAAPPRAATPSPSGSPPL